MSLSLRPFYSHIPSRASASSSVLRATTARRAYIRASCLPSASPLPRLSPTAPARFQNVQQLRRFSPFTTPVELLFDSLTNTVFTTNKGQELEMDTVHAARDWENVLQGKYPAKSHAKKVKEWILNKGGDGKGTIYLEAQKSKYLEVCWFWFLFRG